MENKTDIIWLDSTDSTNEEARRHILSLDNLSVVSALEQTSGRGQRGNSWHSDTGKNLTFSIVLKHPSDSSGDYSPLTAHSQTLISELTAVSVREYLATLGIEASVKWPNDIIAGDKKICGILIEHSVRGNLLSHSIIGIGLNINQKVFGTFVPNATSIILEKGPEASESDIRQSLEDFMKIFKDNYSRYLRDVDGHKRLREEYLSRLWRINQDAAYMDLKGQHPTMFRGRITGLSDIGHLLVQTEEGEFREFAFKEIGFLYQDFIDAMT